MYYMFYANKHYYYNNEIIKLYYKINITSFTKKIYIVDFNNKIMYTSIVTFVNNETDINLPNLKSNVYNIFCDNIAYPITILTKEEKDIIVVFPINTIQAYNKSGGKNLYHSFLPQHKGSTYENRARKVVYNRYIDPQRQILLFESEFIKWFGTKNYNMKYITDHQLDELNNFNNCKLLIIIGHNEYITRKAMDNIQKFINLGKNMLVLSGNTFWWQVRYENNMNVLVCYKNSDDDPIKDEKLKTVNLPNQMDIYGLIGLDFRLGGYGRKNPKSYNEYCNIKNLSNNGNLSDAKIDYSKIKSNAFLNLPGFNGIKIIDDNILFKDIVKKNDILQISSAESDGFKVTSFIDNKLLYDKSEFYRYKVLGYDLLWRGGLTIAGFIACQKTASSGIVINTGTTDWCSKYGMGGPSSKEIKQITTNMIDLLIRDNKSCEKIFT